ncbi:MAG: lcfB 2, partial [Rhizobacter sp.]|nr:lcfB 2 [Rhizobacter sp.]
MHRTYVSGLAPTTAAGLASLVGQYRQQVRCSGASVALQEADRRLSYAEFDERVNRLANGLAAMGLVPGDRVALLSENRLEYVEFEMAAAKLGVILACQNWRQSDAELAYCIELVSPRLLVHSARHAAVAARIEHGVQRLLDIDADYEALLASSSTDEPDFDHDPEAGLIILYTSGTTGMPKGALISQRAMLARSVISRIDGATQPSDTFIAWAPLFHMVSTDSVFATLLQGGKVIVMDGLQLEELVRVTSEEFIGHLTLMPGMVDRVIDEIERTGRMPKGARSIGCMADLVPRDQIARVTTLYNAPFRNSFGATETGSAPASRGLIDIGVLPTSLSKTQNSFCEIRLVDHDGVDVPDGQPGELAFRGPSLFSGYWAADEVNARDFRGGWFHMGDVFVRNPDGTLDFVDRRKYLIKSGGENIYPAEIERVLLGVPGVTEAVVVRRPDAKWGEVPVAFVSRSVDSVTAEALVAACKREIASYKAPKHVVFIPFDDFPRSTTGKVKRHELEERLAREPA